MLLINFDIIDGCNYSRQENITKTFINIDAFNEYEKMLNSGFYEIRINYKKEVEK